MGGYYDGTKLLSLKDINGDVPEIYICTSNRSAGKTIYFNRLAVNRFLKYGEKFGLIYRFKYELHDIEEKFFKEIQSLFFKGYTMKSEKRANGTYHELFLKKNSQDDDAWVSCGYALSLNSADTLKRNSHLLSDTKLLLFDEFQSETNNYCDNEVTKFISVHTSIARGGGEQHRYLPVYMIANPVTILNPYYVEMGISERIDNNTNFLRGEGFVLEQGYNESASQALKASAFNRAFATNAYIAYSSEGNYLNDSDEFVEKVEGKSRYIATLKYMGSEYAIREFSDLGILYCDNRPDTTFKHKLAVTTDDHQINYVMLKQNSLFLTNMRYFFSRGVFRFKNLQCKQAIIKALSY